jgi:hypothetical protein
MRAVRVLVVGVFVTLALVACAATNGTRDYKLGSGPDACWATESGCRRDNDCCSLWCVNGVCDTRNP